jgi:hypothetical protein
MLATIIVTLPALVSLGYPTQIGPFLFYVVAANETWERAAPVVGIIIF